MNAKKKITFIISQGIIVVPSGRPTSEPTATGALHTPIPHRTPNPKHRPGATPWMEVCFWGLTRGRGESECVFSACHVSAGGQLEATCVTYRN